MSEYPPIDDFGDIIYDLKKYKKSDQDIDLLEALEKLNKKLDVLNVRVDVLHAKIDSINDTLFHLQYRTTPND
jgi:hypothetical protein